MMPVTNSKSARIGRYLTDLCLKNKYIKLGNVLSDMLQTQIDTTRKEILQNEF